MINAPWLDRAWLARVRGQRDNAADGIRTLLTSRGRMRVRDVGHGARSLVFVCDMPMLIEHHAELFALLREDFRVLCLELPGLGFSQPSCAASRFEAHAGTTALCVAALESASDWWT